MSFAARLRLRSRLRPARRRSEAFWVAAHVERLETRRLLTAPVAADASFAVAEDGTLTNRQVTANDADEDPLTFSVVGTPPAGLTLRPNGTFDYAPPANFHGTVTFDFSASDGTSSDQGTVTLTVAPVNDAPVAGAVTVSNPAEAGDPVVVSGSFTDVDGPAGTHTVTIAWGDGTTSAATVTPATGGGWTYTAQHVYQQPGTYDVLVTVKDQPGATSIKTAEAAVPGVRLVDGVLEITGTDDADEIAVELDGESIVVTGLGEPRRFRAADVERLRISLGGGNDELRIKNRIEVSSFIVLGDGDDVAYGGVRRNVIDAGGGDDEVYGCRGNDVLVGGAGDDTLRGGWGDDLIAGGDGADELRGCRGNDVAIGGDGEDDIYGSSGGDLLDGDDPDLTDEELAELFEAWTGDGSFADRREAADEILGEPEDDGEADDLQGAEGNDYLVSEDAADAADAAFADVERLLLPAMA